MPTFTRIVKVGAFTDDIAKQINDNFAQLGTVLQAHGIDVNEEHKDQPAFVFKTPVTPLQASTAPVDTHEPSKQSESPKPDPKLKEEKHK